MFKIKICLMMETILRATAMQKPPKKQEHSFTAPYNANNKL